MNTSTQIGKSRIRIRLTVNGEERDVILTNPLSRLLDVLRDDLGLTGTKEGCGEGECGACSVLLNGKLVNSCLVPAAQVDGAVVLTPEGLAETDGGRLLAECFTECHGAQCGFCTPGMMMATASLLAANPDPDEQAIREGLAGNLCRCTGYDMIIDAIQMAAKKGRGLWEVILRPENLAEALEFRSRTGATPLAGGTDLMVRHRAKNGLPPTVPTPVLFVDSLPELRGVRLDGDVLEIGASVPLAVIADDPGERADWAARESGSDSASLSAALAAIPDVLRSASADLGAPALRQRATLAGNLANASPAGDTVAALYALDAELVLVNSNAERTVPLAEFIIGPGKTVLADDELILAVRIPLGEGVLAGGWNYWRKVGTRRANALTKVSLAAAAGVTGGRIVAFSMAFGAVGPIVVRVPEAESLVIGLKAADFDTRERSSLVRRLKDVIAPHITPIDDQRSTAHYRKAVSLNLISEAIESLAQHLKEYL
jgi:xanthine dehydrogenase iron-sulfur cluster and FAD-binding subunit A